MLEEIFEELSSIAISDLVCYQIAVVLSEVSSDLNKRFVVKIEIKFHLNILSRESLSKLTEIRFFLKKNSNGT